MAHFNRTLPALYMAIQAGCSWSVLYRLSFSLHTHLTLRTQMIWNMTWEQKTKQKIEGSSCIYHFVRWVKNEKQKKSLRKRRRAWTLKMAFQLLKGMLPTLYMAIQARYSWSVLDSLWQSKLVTFDRFFIYSQLVESHN